MAGATKVPAELGNPVGFALGVLQVPLYGWQSDVLFDLAEPGQVAVRCPNEAGKTGHIAVSAVLWHMMCFPGSITVATSGSWRQVKNQLIPGLARQRAKPCFKGWEFNAESIKAPNGAVFYGFSTNDPGKFEGFHNLPEIEVAPGVWERPPLFILVDEAKTVAAGIFEAIDRCRPDRLLLLSSPGGSKGEFYHAFGKNKAQYHTHTAGFKDCPHFDADKIDKIIAKYGANHPFVLSSVHGEFADDPDDGTVIPSQMLERCRQHAPVWRGDGERHAFCDFAAGGDENVIALREGNRVRLIKCWRETNTMAACGEFIRQFRKFKLSANEISADNGGLGRPMVDRFAELGWEINRVEFGGKPHNPQAYQDRGSEMYGEAARTIEEAGIILEDDDELDAQLCSRVWENRASDGRLKLVSKKEMKKAGLPSPDRADAVVGAMQPLPAGSQNLARQAKENSIFDALEERTNEMEMSGFDAGF